MSLPLAEVELINMVMVADEERYRLHTHGPSMPQVVLSLEVVSVGALALPMVRIYDGKKPNEKPRFVPIGNVKYLRYDEHATAHVTTKQESKPVARA